MSQKRINVGILEAAYKDADIASSICGEKLQDFATKATQERASKVIADFKSGRKTSHSRRDTTLIAGK